MFEELKTLISMPLIMMVKDGMRIGAEHLVMCRRLIQLISDSDHADNQNILNDYDAEFTRLIDMYNAKFAAMGLDEILAYLEMKGSR